MSSEEVKNMALVRRFMEAQANANLDTLDELLAPDFVDHSSFANQEHGREGYKQQVAEQLAALSEVRCIIEDQLAKGEKVVTRITWRSIHDRGEYFGLMPRGTEVEVTAMTMHRIVGGKITEEWSEWSEGSGSAEVAQAHLEQEVRKRERVEHDLRMARSIQQASLPKEVPTLEGWRITPYYKPAREVGGDFYDFHLLPEGRLGLVVGDATGKGVSAALVISTTCGMLRLAAQSHSSPSQMLQGVNEILFPNIPTNMFVTCFYAILNPKSGHLSYANAGHDLPYLHRNGEAEELSARGMPLGLMSKMSYEEKETTLHVGEAALLYSDGLVEAHDPEGEMFGFPRLRALLAEHSAEDERLVGDFLMEELYSFVGEGWEQEDDITLLTLKRSASLS